MTNSAPQLPQPRIIDPASVPSLRWGVMGAADIAQVFVAAVQKHTKQQIIAVASRTPGKAEAFGEKFGIQSHNNYEDLLARDDIDVIYIPTLPTQHRDHALMAIAAGKHVLVEKPLALDPKEAAEIFAAAKAKGVLAMEAMWTRYLPHYDVLRQLLESNALGNIDILTAHMAQANLEIPRLWKKGHGDPFFDMGIYPISFAQTLLGNPTSITAQAIMHGNRIEEEVSVQLGYESGARAYIVLSARAAVPGIASVGGEKAKITVGPEFFIPATVTIANTDFGSPYSAWNDETGVVAHEGLSYQATHMAKFISEGLLESPYESHADSIANLEVCAEVIRLIGAEIL